MRLLGVHVIGEQATELVHVGLTALLLGQTADLFIQTCFNYPTLTELYKYAAYDALRRRGAGILRECTRPTIPVGMSGAPRKRAAPGSAVARCCACGGRRRSCRRRYLPRSSAEQ